MVTGSAAAVAFTHESLRITPRRRHNGRHYHAHYATPLVERDAYVTNIITIRRHAERRRRRHVAETFSRRHAIN